MPDDPRQRWWMLKHRYGLSQADFEAMLEAQGHRCACCGEPFVETPHVDHRHVPGERRTGRVLGEVRGLLCRTCNVLVGFIEHPKYDQALQYIKEFHGGNPFQGG